MPKTRIKAEMTENTYEGDTGHATVTMPQFEPKLVKHFGLKAGTYKPQKENNNAR